MKFLIFWLVTSFYGFNGGNDNCDNVPDLNRQIVAFVKGRIDKKVGRGECWDLAAEALNKTGAVWDRNYKFGDLVNIKKDCVYPGDIFQFEGVEIEYREGNTFFNEQMVQHTAIVYSVRDKGSFVIAQQNTSAHGRKVSLDPLELKNIKKGSFKVYRPVK